jgi:uncharacterized delta-60 repeat protein
MKFIVSIASLVLLSFSIVAQQLTLVSNAVVNGEPYITAMAQGSDGSYFFSSQIDHSNNQRTGSLTKTNQNGVPSSSFSSVDVNDHIFSIKELPDGKILIGGWFNKINDTYSASVVRLNANGTIDGGFLPFRIPFSYEYVSRIAVQSDGKIIVAGSFTNYLNSGYDNILRLHPDGSLDHSFAKNIVALNYILFVEVDEHDMLAVSDTKTLYKLSPDGALAPGFTPLSANSSGHFYNFKFINENEILVAGTFESFGGIPVKNIARIKSNGTVDAAFDPGKLTYQIFGLAVKADGSFIVVDGGSAKAFDNLGNFKQEIYGDKKIDGLFRDNTGNIFLAGSFHSIMGVKKPFVSKLKDDLTLDNSFTSLLTYTTGITNIAAQSDGKVLVGGSYRLHDINNFDSRLIRINLDGTVDQSFIPQTTIPNSLCLLPDGKILVVEYFGTLARLLSTGVKDESFHQPKIVSNDYVSAMSVYGDKIYLSGNFASVDGTSSQGMIRLNMDGTVDNSFKSTLPPSSFISSFNFQSNGKIIAAGTFPLGGGPKGILRLNSNGSLDDTFFVGEFSSNGISQIRCDYKDRIYICGSFPNLNGNLIASFARLKKNGEVDLDFAPGFTSLGMDFTSMEILSDSTVFVGSKFYQHEFLVFDTTGQKVETEYLSVHRNSDLSASHFDGKTLFIAGRILSETRQVLAGIGYVNLLAVTGSIKNLSASRTAVEKIKLTWENGFTNADAILVERSENNHDAFTTIKTLQPNVISYDDSDNIKAESSYYYRLRASNSGSFGAYSNETHVLDTLVVGIAEKYGFRTLPYPNPTKDVLQVRGENNKDRTAILYGQDGKKITTLKFVDNSIDVSGLPASRYILILYDGKKVVSQISFVKE